jgi:hypothetical protein
MEHRNHSAGFSRSNVDSYSEVHQRAFLIFKEIIKSGMYLRETAESTEG